MSGDGEFLEYLDLQGNADMLTKSELLEYVRAQGGQISDRTLTYYTSNGLIPRSVRVGSRAGAYPKVVGHLLSWIAQARERNLGIEAIRELVPLWKHLMRGFLRDCCINLAEFEYVARQNELSPEASFAVPYLFSETLPLCSSCLEKIDFVLKDGSTAHHTPQNPLRLNFLLGEVNPETGKARRVAWTQLELPGIAPPSPTDPATIVLGVPVAVPFEETVNQSAHVSLSQQKPKNPAVTPLSQGG